MNMRLTVMRRLAWARLADPHPQERTGSSERLPASFRLQVPERLYGMSLGNALDHGLVFAPRRQLKIHKIRIRAVVISADIERTSCHRCEVNDCHHLFRGFSLGDDLHDIVDTEEEGPNMLRSSRPTPNESKHSLLIP